MEIASNLKIPFAPSLQSTKDENSTIVHLAKSILKKTQLFYHYSPSLLISFLITLNLMDMMEKLPLFDFTPVILLRITYGVDASHRPFEAKKRLFLCGPAREKKKEDISLFFESLQKGFISLLPNSLKCAPSYLLIVIATEKRN